MKNNLSFFAAWSLCFYAFFSTVSITLSEGFFLLSLAFAAVDIFKNKKNLKEFFSNPVTLPLAIFLLVHLLAALFGVDVASSLKNYKQVYLFFILFVSAAVLDSKDKIIKAVMFFVAGADSVALYMIIITILHKYIEGDIYFRPSSFSGTYMHAGGFMMMAIILIFAMLIYYFKYEKKEKSIRVFYVISFLLTAAALIFTSTRGSWIGAFFGIILVLFYTDKKLALLFLLVIAGTLFFMKDTSYVKRMTGIFNEVKSAGTSPGERILMWKSGLVMIKERPWLGVGTANVDKVYPKYVSLLSKERNQGHLHNNLIQIAVIDGLIGLAAFMWLFITVWNMLGAVVQRLRDVWLKTFVFSVLAMSVAFFINGFFEYNFLQTQTAMIFWFLTGTAIAAGRNKEIENEKT